MPEPAFIVDSSPSVTTAPPALGYWERRCDACGSRWGPEGCTRDGCVSMAFSTSYNEPKPILTGIREKLAPKPKPVRASASQLSNLRGLLGTLRQVLDDLRREEQELRAAVVGGTEELIPLQALLNRACATIGDRSVERVSGFSLGLESLVDCLAVDINNINEDSK
jgi:hypothetical protein